MCTSPHLQRWFFGSLLVMWMLMGSIAFAEQVNVMTETGSQDEQALEHLKHAIKPEAVHDSMGAWPQHLLPLLALVQGMIPDATVVLTPVSSLVSSSNTRSLVLLTACYRI